MTTAAIEKFADAHWGHASFIISAAATGYGALYGSGDIVNLTSDHNGLLAAHPDKGIIAIFACMFFGVVVNAWMMHHTFKGNEEYLARIEASWLGSLLTPFLILGFLTQMFITWLIIKAAFCATAYVGLLVVLPIYGGYRLLRWAFTK
jgi:hypothetical protein